jgi:hypothetical protein
MSGKRVTDRQVRRYTDSQRRTYPGGRGCPRRFHRAHRTPDGRLFGITEAARRDLGLPGTLAKLDRFDVLVLDDLGYVRKD